MNTEFLLPTKLTCGYFDSSAFGSLRVSPKRVSTMFEIEYFLRDGNHMFSNGIAYPIRRSFVRICSPGEERYSELPFQTKYVKFMVEGRLAEALRSAPRYFPIVQSLELTELLDELLAAYSMQERDDILLYGKLLSYIALVLKNADRSAQVASYQSEMIVMAQEFIRAHYGESIQLCDIAKAVNLSPNYFHTLFSKACGQTPREYLEEYRVRIAKKLLLTTHLSLCAIAEECGFHNQQYLTTVFKTRVGCAPTQFRSQHQSAYFT